MLKIMLKEKEEGKTAGLNKKSTGRENIEKILLDLAGFSFSLNDSEGSTKKIKKLLMKYTGASGCSLMFLDQYGYLWKVGEATTSPLKLGTGIAGWAAEHKKKVYVENINKDKRYKTLSRWSKNVSGAIVAVPVLKSGQVLGIINLTYSGTHKKLFPPDQRILDVFAEKIANDMENIILFHEVNDQKDELLARKNISNILDSDLPFKRKMEEIKKKTINFVEIDSASICVMSSQGITLMHDHSQESKGRKSKLASSLIDMHKKGNIEADGFTDLSSKLDFELMTKKGTGYTTTYPIFSGRKVVGFILIEDGVKNTDNLSVQEKNFIDLVSRRVSRYITSQRSAEKMIEEKERWRTIFHNVDDGMLLLSKDKVVIEANLKARAVLGTKNTDLTGRDFFSLLQVIDPGVEIPTLSSLQNINRLKKVDQQELSKKIDSFFSSQKAIRPKEYYIKTKNGKYWVMVSMKSAMQDPDSKLFGIIHIKDVTKTKEVEQDKNEFMSMVSHELRTPLSAMKGYLSMILGNDYGKLSKQQVKSLRRVEESNERMVSLVEDILDVSRIELGRFSLHKEPINLSGITCDMVRELGAKLQEKNITLKIQGKIVDPCLKKARKDPWHTCKNLGLYVLADRHRLMQILGNLIDNAIKYSFAGGKIDINVKSDRNFVEISIKDEGVGVTKEDQDKLFRRFSRIHNPLSIQAGGTGLGLYITKKLILAHGGEISVVSKQGKGTTFSVKMPIAKQLPLI